MTTTDLNKQIVSLAMEAMARGDSRPFYDAWAEDVVWRQMAVSGPWCGSFHGKQAVRDELFTPLRRQFADTYSSTATNILADGDFVVVEARGAATLKNGKSYGNQYCFVIRMENGRMKEIREYLDSALSEAVLEPL